MSEDKKNKIIDIIQWILILALSVYCVLIGRENKKMSSYYEIKKENTYLKIYDSQAIEDLKIKNKILGDSLKSLKNVESVVNVEYVYKYISDTVYVDNSDKLDNDTIYHYQNVTDSISYNLDIKAKSVYWHKLDLSINDNMMLVTREKNNKVETSLTTGYGNIGNVDTWHRKNKTFKDRFVIGPSVGVGYGMINNKFDFFIGVSATFDIL